jgi:lysophospholipase L1-like esterase
MSLIEAGHPVDMIGPLEDPSRYPTVNGQTFDPDHAGVGGFETTDILDNLDVIFESDQRPDFILIGIGGNDLINSKRTPEQVATNITNIVSELAEAYPSAHIIIEQIAPGKSAYMTDQLTRRFETFNAALATHFWANAPSNISAQLINMTDGWSDDYLADPVHYNEAGARFVAERYFSAIEGELGR